MIIRIKDLKLRTIIGFKEWEREKKQDITINLRIETDETGAAQSDDVKDTIDYKVITKRIITEVEATDFKLLEALSGFILDLVMEDERIEKSTVEIDKPHALRFTRSVSIEMTRKRA
ncbi:MAG: dihydroneopterin aldolase [Thermodesulfobacteriota bacterium]